MALATTADLAHVLGVAFDAGATARAEVLLDLASGDVAAYCDLVSLVRLPDDVIELAGSYSAELPLPGGPVVNVGEVRLDGEVVTDFQLAHGPDRLIRGSTDTGAYPFGRGHWGGPASTVQITYTHGFATPPDDVRSAVLDLAARKWNRPVGIRAEQLGAESVTYETGAATGLTDNQKADLSRFHRSAATVGVG